VKGAARKPWDTVEQWLRWEQRANLIGFRANPRPFELELASVPRSAVDVRMPAGELHPVVARFVRGERVLIPKHPLNRDRDVAFFGEPCAERWKARYTSSRTLAVPGDPLFSIKLPTDHPHRDFAQPEKTRVREEAEDALRWMQLLDRADALLPPEPSLLVIREALVILVPGSESAVVVRDLSPFRKLYYLPGLSIPWVGHAIARRHGSDFATYWAEHYAAPTGRAKAALFARTGLQQTTPNPQNLLVELDPRLRPTGRIALRDIGDADCATNALECTQSAWTQLTDEVKPEFQNSFWAFGEAGDHSVEPSILERWYAEHERAYFATLARYFPGLAPSDPGLETKAALEHWNGVLRAAR
jgi:hypothetical protein